MMFSLNRTATLLGCLLATAAQTHSAEAPTAAEPGKVVEYWSGAAEISRYQLSQARYGEQREGEAVLIFVREPFLPTEQVKDESGGAGVSTLKLNSSRNFLTGIYPYSTMVSVFQPFGKSSLGNAFKVTTSVQEWCGHVFTQTNRKPSGVRTLVWSYFEKEEGTQFVADEKMFLEDEVWTTLRLAPQSLPSGRFEMIPGSLFSRLAHLAPEPTRASAEWMEGSTEETLVYRIKYSEVERFLEIEVGRNFPHTIKGWRESHGKEVTTAKLTDQLRNSDYWSLNADKDRALRSKLGLDTKR